MPKTKLVKCKYCNKIIKYEDSYKTIYYNKYFRHYCSKEHQYYIENFQRYWCVYMHINKINDKKYIGITKNKTYSRWQNGKGYMKFQDVFGKAIQKYGWENFEHKILFKNLTHEEAKSKEKLLIKYYNTYINAENSMGYNMTLGGDGHFVGKNKKLSKKYKGKGNPMYGKNYEDYMTQEAILARREKVSKALKGRIFSEEHNQKISQSKKGIKDSPQAKENKKKAIRKFWDENINKIYRKGYKKVICENKIYNSISNCAKYYNIAPYKMGRWLLGKNKMPQDFINKGLSYYNE